MLKSMAYYGQFRKFRQQQNQQKMSKTQNEKNVESGMQESKHILSTVLYTSLWDSRTWDGKIGHYTLEEWNSQYIARDEWKSGTLGIMTQQHEGYNRFRYVIPRKMATPRPTTCAWIGERPKCPWCHAQKMRYRPNNKCTCGECNSKKPCDHPAPVWLE